VYYSEDISLSKNTHYSIFKNQLIMSADKKINKDKLPHPVGPDTRNKGQEEFDDKSKILKERKVQRVNYIVKDLPIY
jgi:hypothetical protein